MDIVERLRIWVDSTEPTHILIEEAADEIERLRGERWIALKELEKEVLGLHSEIERLRDALKIISCKCKSNCGKDEGNCLYWIARSTLQQKESE